MSLDVREAVVLFQYVERVKSGLIVASKLVGEVAGFSEGEREGARKLLVSFIQALIGEVSIAYNVLRTGVFRDVCSGLERCIKDVRSGKFDEAVEEISRAISLATTKGQEATEFLIEKGIL